MSYIITKCERHGIIKREPTPGSITYMGDYRPWQMRYCPYCGKRTTIEWPDEEDTLSWSAKVYFDHTSDESEYLPPWEE